MKRLSTFDEKPSWWNKFWGNTYRVIDVASDIVFDEWLSLNDAKYVSTGMNYIGGYKTSYRDFR